MKLNKTLQKESKTALRQYNARFKESTDNIHNILKSDGSSLQLHNNTSRKDLNYDLSHIDDLRSSWEKNKGYKQNESRLPRRHVGKSSRNVLNKTSSRQLILQENGIKVTTTKVRKGSNYGIK